MKILVTPIVYNEQSKIQFVLDRLIPWRNQYDILFLNDSSNDKTSELIEQSDFKMHTMPTHSGVGACIREAIRLAIENKYEALVVMAGNDKDRPAQIERLIRPIFFEGYDLVQGSRYLEGGETQRMPFYRSIATKFIHPFLLSYISGQRFTDSTNGFRAIRVTALADTRIDFNQSWLDHYELEPYLLYKMVQLGYKVKEVGVSKIYPKKNLGGYTKMKPITGWWSILRPLVYLWLGIKK